MEKEKMKLEILKDLKINLSVIAPHLTWKSEVIEYKVAKQLAIKWIKCIQSDIDKTKSDDSYDFGNQIDTAYHQGSIDILKTVCDIQESDLK